MKKIFLVSLLAVIGFTSKAQSVGNTHDCYTGVASSSYRTIPNVWYDSNDGKVHFSITFYFPSDTFTYDEADAGIWYSPAYPPYNLTSTGESEYFDPYENPIPSEGKTYEGTIDVTGISSTISIELEYGMNLSTPDPYASYNVTGIFTFDFTP